MTAVVAGEETVTVTVVFTDMVGSTELAEAAGPGRADELRREHFTLLRRAIASSRGTEVKNLGDGVMAVFASVANALDAAVAIQQSHHARNRHADVPLEVRVGVANGDVTAEDGDYFGPPVVEAARLCALAAGGEILLTEVVRLLAGRTGHAFDARGEIGLKGLAEAVTVSALAWTPAPDETDTGAALPTRLATADTSSFVGRAEEWQTLERAWKAVAAGEGPRVVLLSGEPGAGKTALAARFARAASEGASTVLFGRCNQDLGLPYEPFVEALEHLVSTHGRDPVEELGGAHTHALARIVPALRPAAGSLVPADEDADADRHQLFAAVRRIVRTVAAPGVLVLDDLQWADRASVQMLRHVLAAPVDLLVLVTCRDTDVVPGEAVASLLADLRRQPGAERVRLGGLGDTEVAALMESLAGHDLDDETRALADAVHRETDGNPFFCRELLRHLVETGAVHERDGRWSLRTGDRFDLPSSLREVVGDRVRRLGEDTHRLLSVAAVIGRDFHLTVLSEVADISEDDALDVLERAEAAGIVREDTTRTDRFTFAHAVIQRTLYEELAVSRRTRLHRRIAETLEDGAAPAGETAHHWLAANRPDDLERAIDAASRAGAEAMASLAPQEAARWYSRVLELFDQTGERETERRCEALVGLGAAQRAAGEPFTETLLQASAMAGLLGSVALEVRAALLNTRGYGRISGSSPDIVRALERAIHRLGPEPSVERARLLATLVAELSFDQSPGLHTRRLQLMELSLDAAEQTGDDHAIVAAACAACQAMTSVHMAERRSQVLAATRAAAVRVSDLSARYWLLQWDWYDARQRGDGARHRSLLPVMDELVEAAADETLVLGNLFHDVEAAVTVDSDVARSERLAAEYLRLGEAMGQTDVQTLYEYGLRAVIDTHRGTMRALPHDVPLAPLRAGLSRALSDVGAVAAAVEILDAEADGGFEVPEDLFWSIYHAHLARVACLHRPQLAATLYERMLPFEDMVVFGGVADGPFASHLGRLAAAMGDDGRAEEHFEHGLGVLARDPAPFFDAETRLDLADLLARRRRTGDQHRATALLAEAADISGRAGCEGLARRAREWRW